MDSHDFSDFTKKSEKEIISDVKFILASMSKSKFAYDMDRNIINFDVAVASFSSENKYKLVQVMRSFVNCDDQKIEEIFSDNLALFLDFFYRTIMNIKNVAKYGNVYYEIIVRYYIEKEFRNIDDAVESINGVKSRATFIRRSNEACYQLYVIWYCIGPQYIQYVLDSLALL